MTDKQIITTLNKCRLCKSTHIQPGVIDLGEQVITSRWPIYGDFSTPKTPVSLCLCRECGLLQLYQTTNSSELYEHEYGYRSGISNTMRTHLKEYKDEIESKVAGIIKSGDMILDIGSNDSTMLQYYDAGYTRIGCDPTGKQFSQYYGDVALIPDYFTLDNFRNRYGPDQKCTIVSSISMFYDLPDPVQFATDIYNILADDGIWTCEQSYLLSMLRTNSIDTICHEHLEYYALTQIKRIADMAGFKIIDVKFNDCNGGSFRVYFAKRESHAHTEAVTLIQRILDEELQYGILDMKTYSRFINDCWEQINRLNTMITRINNAGKRIYIYGASTKGNCLLQYAGITEMLVPYAVERNPSKVGKMTATGIPIISEETMRAAPPEFLLVLPWHFKTEILARETEFLDAGGQFIFPFPEFQIVSKRPKMLITGCDGMIAHYVKQEFHGDMNLYGICKSSRERCSTDGLIKGCINMLDDRILENELMMIRPDIIIHLASISSARYALEHPVTTLETNGLLVAKICDIIQRNRLGCKLFNASSSEMYKGHIDYDVIEDDGNKKHIHPYSIAKAMAHDMVIHYREKYGMYCVNGVLFTIESSKKRPEFLLNKVAEHIRSWKCGLETELVVGPLDSLRNILHASDAAKAIRIIMTQPEPQDYLICNDYDNILVNVLVETMFKLADLDVVKNCEGNYVMADNPDRVILKINRDRNGGYGFDSQPTNIRGYPTKLLGLGWKINYKPEAILKDILDG